MAELSPITHSAVRNQMILLSDDPETWLSPDGTSFDESLCLLSMNSPRREICSTPQGRLTFKSPNSSLLNDDYIKSQLYQSGVKGKENMDPKRLESLKHLSPPRQVNDNSSVSMPTRKSSTQSARDKDFAFKSPRHMADIGTLCQNEQILDSLSLPPPAMTPKTDELTSFGSLSLYKPNSALRGFRIPEARGVPKVLDFDDNRDSQSDGEMYMDRLLSDCQDLAASRRPKSPPDDIDPSFQYYIPLSPIKGHLPFSHGTEFEDKEDTGLLGTDISIDKGLTDCEDLGSKPLGREALTNFPARNWHINPISYVSHDMQEPAWQDVLQDCLNIDQDPQIWMLLRLGRMVNINILPCMPLN